MRSDDGTTMPTGRMARGAVAAAVGAALVLAVLAPPASAQQVPTATASVACRDDAGWISVEITTAFQSSFWITIDDVLVADGIVIDPPGGIRTYGPYADGDHTVVVDWDGNILDTTVSVACEPAPTTTTSTTSTTAPPVSVAPSTTIAPTPVVVAPAYTG